MSFPSSLSHCVRRPWAQVLALCIWLFVSAAPLQAVVYDLPYAYGSDFAFSLSVDGEGVEEVDKRLQVDEMERPRANLILFGVGRVNLKMTARYIGSRPLAQGSVQISMFGSDVAPYCQWTADGATATATVDLYTYVALELIDLPLLFEATASVSNNGGSTYVTTSKSGFGSVYLRKPMTLKVDVLDAMLEISAHKPHPYFSSEGTTVIDDFVQDPLDGVGIKIQRTANRIRVPKTDWTLTSQSKFLSVPIGAPLNSVVDPAKKAVLDDIVVFAVKERTRLAVIEPVELPVCTGGRAVGRLPGRELFLQRRHPDRPSRGLAPRAGRVDTGGVGGVAECREHQAAVLRRHHDHFDRRELPGAACASGRGFVVDRAAVGTGHTAPGRLAAGDDLAARDRGHLGRQGPPHAGG